MSKKKKSGVQMVEDNVEVTDVDEFVEDTQDVEKEYSVEAAGNQEEQTSVEEPKFVQEIQLSVHEKKVIPVFGKRVVIENIGVGDVYVDVTSVKFSHDSLVRPGESRVYENVQNIYIGSASRPTIRISHF